MKLFKISKGVEALIEDMKNNPQDYKKDNYVFKRGELEIWVGNQSNHYVYRPYKAAFSFFEKRAFHRALKLWEKSPYGQNSCVILEELKKPAA